MLKQNILYLVLILTSLSCLCSCRTSKQLSYFKDLADSSAVSKIHTLPYEPLKLQANDEVQITISSISPEASQFFNLVTPSPSLDAANINNQSPGHINQYRVSATGFITLPVLSDIQAASFTTEELRANISERLKDYLKDAVVTVRITNFKVTVIGEVGNPIVIPVNGQTINVLEAVGAAGDMTVFGMRKNVKVIRKLPDGNTEVAVLNFNKANVLQSPWFQLRQNDIVYIQPNKSKSLLSSKATVWAPILTSIVYIAAIIVFRN